MTNSEAIEQLKFLNKVDFHIDTKEACDIAIDLFQENDKLKAEIEQLKEEVLANKNWSYVVERTLKKEIDKNEQLKSELEQSVKFKEYFMELYSQGLEVLNWHLNGDLEPLTNFIDSALEEAEQHLKGKVENE